jgi:hypothetical protein
MVLIEKFKAGFVSVLLIFLCVSFPAFGQSPGSPNPPPPSTLAAEIRDLEAGLENPGLGPADRRGVLARLAWLYRLAGNIEAAAEAWTAGAYADPAARDDQALLEAALCYITLGEFEKADANIRPVFISGGSFAGNSGGSFAGNSGGSFAGNSGHDPETIRRARYIGAQIELFRTGQSQALYSLLESPEFLDYRPPIYYTFWRVYGDSLYRVRLLEEFPASPEAAILLGENAARAVVSEVPHALWFFFPGRGQVTLSAPVPGPAAVVTTQVTAPPAPAVVPGPVTAPPAAAPVQASASGGPRIIQTGLFSREGNARNMAERLRGAGFVPEVSMRTVNGASYWAVSVPPGDDPNNTTMRLKDAGFEAFPVY